MSCVVHNTSVLGDGHWYISNLISWSHVSISYNSVFHTVSIDMFNPLTISITYPVIILPEYDDREDRQRFKLSVHIVRYSVKYNS